MIIMTHELFLVILAAIATVVTIAEILKNSGFAVEKSKDGLLLLANCYLIISLMLHVSIVLY